jgi:hypothetical protein
LRAQYHGWSQGGHDRSAEVVACWCVAHAPLNFGS